MEQNNYETNRVSLYSSSLDCASIVWKTEGLFGFMRGLEASFLRSGIWNGIYFGCIYELNKRLEISDPRN